MKQFLTSFLHFAPDNGSGMHRLWTDNGPMKSRKLFAVLTLLLFVGVGNAWGATATFTISGKSGSSTPYTVTGSLSGAPTGATASCQNTYNNANQLTSGHTMTLTLSGFDGCTISGLSLSARSNTSSPYKGAATITININGSSKGSLTSNRPGASYAARAVTVTSTVVNENADIVITVASSENSYYVQSFTITYTAPTPKTVLFDTGSGNPTVSSRTEASGGAGITLPSTSDLTPSCSSDGWVLYGWTTSAYGSSSTTTAPSATLAGLAGAKYKPSTNNVTLYAVYKKATGDPVARTLSATYASHTGWTESDGMCQNGYWILCTGGTLTSPELVDLSTVTSITFNARTYGGASYNTVNVKTSAGTTVGSATAASTSMVSKTVSVSGLSGSGSIVFSSSTTTVNNGPGMNNVVIYYTETPGLYWSAPTCCTELGTINGSFLWTAHL